MRTGWVYEAQGDSSAANLCLVRSPYVVIPLPLFVTPTGADGECQLMTSACGTHD